MIASTTILLHRTPAVGNAGLSRPFQGHALMKSCQSMELLIFYITEDLQH